jgi:hypothetical protein
VRTKALLVSRSALLLMNNCKTHTGDEVQKVFADYGVMMATYAPQTTNVFQVGDLSLFGLFKLIMSSGDESRTVHEITDHAVRIIRARFKDPVTAQV